jgi:hypothetical protein
MFTAVVSLAAEAAKTERKNEDNLRSFLARKVTKM